MDGVLAGKSNDTFFNQFFQDGVVLEHLEHMMEYLNTTELTCMRLVCKVSITTLNQKCYINFSEGT